MPRHIKVAAAQMGPNNEGTPREAIVERMRSLLREGRAIRAAQEALTELTRLLRGKFEQAVGANNLVDALVEERGS